MTGLPPGQPREARRGTSDEREQVAPTMPGLNPSTRWRIGTSATLGTLFDGADFAVFLIFLVPISHTFGVTVLTVTLVQATSYVAGIAGGVAFGLLADRRGRRLALSLSIAVFSVFTLASAFSPNIWWLLVLRILAGIGIGGESGVAFALINEVFPDRGNRRGTVSGSMQTMFIFGNFIGYALFSWTTTTWGAEAWRWSFALLGVGGLVALAARYSMPESPQWLATRTDPTLEAPSGSAVMREIFGPQLRTRTVKTTLLMTSAFFGAYAVITYAPSMWQKTYHLPAGAVAHIGYAGSVAAILAYFLNGVLSDHIGRRRSFVVFAVIGVLAYVAFGLVTVTGWGTVSAATYWGSPVFWVFLFAEFGYGYHGSQGVWLSELYPTRVRATAQNLVYYVGRGIGAGLLPLLALWIADQLGSDFRLAITFGVVGAAATAMAALTLPETKGRTLQL